jgi:Domain of unknown function (DUF4907)
MIIKHSTVVIFVSAMIAAAIPFFFHEHAQKDVSYKIFKKDSGWGYDISVNGKLFIHQENIPSLAGKRSFTEESHAENTAMLIINKIKRGQLPVVTKFEIQQILSEKCP